MLIGPHLRVVVDFDELGACDLAVEIQILHADEVRCLLRAPLDEACADRTIELCD